MELTKEQKDIINHKGCHSKVMAVAGSGKTTTMIERIIKLIEDGHNPKRILVLMFNSSAAKEFQIKLKNKSKDRGIPTSNIPEVRTFHSMALKICNYFSNNNILKNYKLETRDWVFHKLANETLATYTKSENAKNKKETRETFYQFIDLVNSDILSPKEKMLEMPDVMGVKVPDYFDKAFNSFEKKRKQNNIKFFSNILKDPVVEIINNPNIVSYVENFYDFIILDEYQDINEVQQRMTKFIAGNRAEVMAVGDADQCIYEWRGAKPEYIVKKFEDDFPKSVIYKLSRTYRYGDELSLFVNNIITVNKNRDEKICFSHENTPNTVINQIEEKNTKEPHILINTINANIEEGYKYENCAILLRKFSMSLIPELEMIKNNIPYTLIGSDSVFNRNEILAIECYIHIINNSFIKFNIQQEHKVELIENFLKIPYSGIKTDEARNVAERISYSDDIVSDIVDFLKIKENKSCIKKYKSIKSGIQNKTKKSCYHIVYEHVELNDFISFFERFSSTNKIADEKETLINEFLQYAKSSNENISVFSSKWLDMYEISNNSSKENNKVLITSIHRSKGLEWPIVILPDLSEENFPGKNIDKNKKIEESERRLFYVGSTRAINKLYLFHPKDEILNNWERKEIEPHPYTTTIKASRYLYEGDIKSIRKILLYKNNNVEVYEKFKNENKLYETYFKELKK